MFITIPATQLPNGLAIPSFKAARFLATTGEANPAGTICKRLGDRQPHQAAITADGYPWTAIDYAGARAASAAAGYQLMTESQSLAIAWLIAQQDANWTGGKVGEGSLYQGLRKDTVDCVMPANFGPADPDERRWHELPSGERIFDFAGNAFSWVFDDIQGDEQGLVANRIAADSPSLNAPYSSLEKGMGWRPTGDCKWSGGALVRGGCWFSGSRAGAFRLDRVWPGRRYVSVGFRCTQPIGL